MTSNPKPFANVKALLFDVFGTVVDWRRSTARIFNDQCLSTLEDNANLPESTKKAASAMDLTKWRIFADDWLKEHQDFVLSIASANIEGRAPPPYRTIDEFMLASLPGLLAKWNMSDLWDTETTEYMSRALHRSNAWPDSVEGIDAMNAAGFQTVTLGNGNVELLSAMASHAKLHWTHVMSSADFRTYKPDLKIYSGAAEKLGLKGEECALVAAHLYDLEAAKKCGFRTVYVDRVDEERWGREKVQAAREWVDVWVEIGEEGLKTAIKRVMEKR